MSGYIPCSVPGPCHLPAAGQVDEKVNDSYFSKPAEAEFFEEDTPKKEPLLSCKAVDKAVIEAIKTEYLAKYIQGLVPSPTRLLNGGLEGFVALREARYFYYALSVSCRASYIPFLCNVDLAVGNILFLLATVAFRANQLMADGYDALLMASSRHALFVVTNSVHMERCSCSSSPSSWAQSTYIFTGIHQRSRD